MANTSNILDENQNNDEQNKGGKNFNAVNSSPSFNPNQNQYRNNQSQMQDNIHAAKKQIKKNVLKEGVKKAAQYYGVPEAATERILETQKGKEILDAATDSDSPTETAIKVTKVASKQLLMIILPAVLLPLLLLLFIIVIIGGKDVFAGMGESDDIYEDLRDEVYSVVNKYSSKVKIDGNLIIATLLAYNDNSELDSEEVNSKNVSYMVKQVEKLASYQVITNASCSYNSSTLRNIANNDNLFSEANYNCIPDMEGETYLLSTLEGNYNDNNSGSVYYWNLIDEDFIFNYYNEYMINSHSNTSENEEIINEIISEIYLFYDMMDDMSYDNQTICSDGITLDGVTMNFEDYVKGVVYSYVGDSNLSIEAIKAIAVATRSKALSASNSCNIEIHSQTTNLEYNGDYENNNNVVQAVNETAGQYLTHNEDIFDAGLTTFPDLNSNCNVVCDGNTCSATFSYDYDKKLGTYTVTTPRYVNGVDVANDGVGSCVGISKYAINVDASNGATYKDILKKYYSSNVEMKTIAGDGLVLENGFLKRVERAKRDNLYYYSSATDSTNGYIAGGLEGECAWYAVKRTNEIIATMGLQDKYHYVYSGGNGNDFCYAGDYRQFEKSTNPNDPTLQAGAIISWISDSHEWGHVAVVEAVHRDSNGNITSIDISEAGIGIGQYGRNARLIIGNSANPTLKRQDNCEGNNTGCQQFRNIPISKIKYNSGSFICYLKIVK